MLLWRRCVGAVNAPTYGSTQKSAKALNAGIRHLGDSLLQSIVACLAIKSSYQHSVVVSSLVTSEHAAMEYHQQRHSFGERTPLPSLPAHWLQQAWPGALQVPQPPSLDERFGAAHPRFCVLRSGRPFTSSSSSRPFMSSGRTSLHRCTWCYQLSRRHGPLAGFRDARTRFE